MKIKPVLDRWVEVVIRQQWTALMPHFLTGSKYNWYDFTFINLGCEYDPYGPQFEIHVGLVGFEVSLYFHLPWATEQATKLRETVQEAKDHPETLKSWDEITRAKGLTPGAAPDKTEEPL